MRSFIYILLFSVFLLGSCKDQEDSSTCSCNRWDGTHTTGFDSTITLPTDTQALLIGNNGTALEGNSVQFILPTGNWTGSLWSGGGLSCGTCPNPIVTLYAVDTYPDTNTYAVLLIDSLGNSQTFSSQILITANSDRITYIYIPNAFTPNGDGRSDIFHVYGSGFGPFHLVIKDGSTQVFETYDKTEGWDGKVNGSVPDCSNFTYIVDVTFYDGTTTRYESDVTLFKNNTTCPGNFQNCRYGSQFDGAGFDPNLPGEPGC